MSDISSGKYLLTSAKTSMAQGDYETSLGMSEDILKKYPRTLGDSALYQIGLIHLHPENEKANERIALGAFQRILKEYPESNKREDALVWVFTLRKMAERQEAIEVMTKEIEMLKLTRKRMEKRIDSLTNTLKDRTERISHLESMIKGFVTRIGSLKSQIDELKSVDIGIEKKKRRSLKR
jgi:outer membrane protein assembly factor BamD (BamD/ComL family)